MYSLQHMGIKIQGSNSLPICRSNIRYVTHLQKKLNFPLKKQQQQQQLSEVQL